MANEMRSTTEDRAWLRQWLSTNEFANDREGRAAAIAILVLDDIEKGPTLDPDAIDKVWKATHPDITREQFAHLVTANPATHSFTHREFAAERMAVEAETRVAELMESLRKARPALALLAEG